MPRIFPRHYFNIRNSAVKLGKRRHSANKMPSFEAPPTLPSPVMVKHITGEGAGSPPVRLYCERGSERGVTAKEIDKPNSVPRRVSPSGWRSFLWAVDRSTAHAAYPRDWRVVAREINPTPVIAPTAAPVKGCACEPLARAVDHPRYRNHE